LVKVVAGIGSFISGLGTLITWLRNARIAQTLFNAVSNPASVFLMAAAAAAAVGVIALMDHAEASTAAADASERQAGASGRVAGSLGEEAEAQKASREEKERSQALDEDMEFIQINRIKGLTSERDAILQTIEVLKEKLALEESAGRLGLSEEKRIAEEEKKLRDLDEKDRQKQFDIAKKRREIDLAERKANGNLSRKDELQAELEFLKSELAFYGDNQEKRLDLQKQMAEKRGEIRKAEADEEKKAMEEQEKAIKKLQDEFHEYAKQRLDEINHRKEVEKKRAEDEAGFLDNGVKKQLDGIEKLRISDEEKQEMRLKTLQKYANDARLSEEARAELREQLAEEAAKAEVKWDEWSKDRQKRVAGDRARGLEDAQKNLDELRKQGVLTEEGYAEESRKLAREKAEESVKAAGEAFGKGKKLEQADAQAHVDNLKDILKQDEEFGTLSKKERENINKFLQKTTGQTGDELIAADKKAAEDELANAGKVAEEKFAAEKAANDKRIADVESEIARQKALGEAIKNAPVAAQPAWENLFKAIVEGSGNAEAALKRGLVAPAAGLGAGGGGGPKAAGIPGEVKNNFNVVQNFYGDQNPLEMRRLMDDVSRDLADRIVSEVGGSP